MPDFLVDDSGVQAPGHLLLVESPQIVVIDGLKLGFDPGDTRAGDEELRRIDARLFEIDEVAQAARAFGIAAMGLRIFSEHFSTQLRDIVDAQRSEPVRLKRMHHTRGFDIEDKVVQKKKQMHTPGNKLMGLHYTKGFHVRCKKKVNAKIGIKGFSFQEVVRVP